MSKIKKDIAEICDLNQKRDELDKDFAARLVRAVTDLSDADWKKLSPESQAWFNDAADAVNDKKPIPDFPDAEPAADTGRRAVSRRGESEETPKDPEVGDTVKIITKRGKELEGEITEMDDALVVLNGDEEVGRDRIESITVTKAGKAAASSKSKEPEAPAIATTEIGDEIEAVTKRGKTKAGEVVAIEEGLVIIKDKDGDEDELEVEKLETLKVTKPAKKATTRGTTKTENKAAGDEKKPRTTKADNGGVSATMRIRQLIVEDFDITEEQVLKQLEKEKIQCNKNTMSLVYADTNKVIGLLKEAKRLK